MNLSESERTVLVRLLRGAKEALSLNTCNDFGVEDTPENQQLAQAIARWTGDPDLQWPIGDGEILLTDWLVAGYLADKLERTAKGFGLVAP